MMYSLETEMSIDPKTNTETSYKHFAGCIPKSAGSVHRREEESSLETETLNRNVGQSPSDQGESQS